MAGSNWWRSELSRLGFPVTGQASRGMLSPTQMLQLAVALIPVVGLLVLAVDRMSSQKSITMRTSIKVMGFTLVPAIIILGMQGLLQNPIVAGFTGVLMGFVLGNLVSGD